jgi:fructose-specific phosphotransferase system IIC component
MSPSILSAAIVGVMALALIDLARRDVRHIPKWAWALIIVFLIPPLGVLLYVVLEWTSIGGQGDSGATR